MLVANGIILSNGKNLSLKTKIKDILGDEWVLKDKYAEDRLDLIDLLSECVVLRRGPEADGRYEKWSPKSRLCHQVSQPEEHS
jgi:hypothetical protein